MPTKGTQIEIMDSSIQKIVGPNEVVEINESAIANRKYNQKQLPIRQTWILRNMSKNQITL